MSAVLDPTLGTALSRRHRWALAGPIACGCALAAAAVYVGTHDPSGSATMGPPCPFYSTTGLYCPGCGLTRAAHALLRGDIGAAIGYNLLFPFFFGAIVLAWLGWVRITLGRAARVSWIPALPSWTPVFAGVVLVLFGIVRNLPGLQVLAP